MSTACCDKSPQLATEVKAAKMGEIKNPGVLPTTQKARRIHQIRKDLRIELEDVAVSELRSGVLIPDVAKMLAARIIEWHSINECDIDKNLLLDPYDIIKTVHPCPAIGFDSFLDHVFKPRSMIVEPILPSQGCLLLHAWRGVGKTYFAMFLAYAVAAGSKFLRYNAQIPQPVLYADAEMSGAELQQRFKAIHNSNPKNKDFDPSFLRIITPDLYLDAVPNLATREGQAYIESNLCEISLLVIDNLSTFCSGIEENSASDWDLFQEWLKRLRRNGVSVILVHHESKSGKQRGTSRREDMMDSGIRLKRPEDYSPNEGARFEVHITKGRSFCGDIADPFEAQLFTNKAGKLEWVMKELNERRLRQVVALKEEGLSVRAIASRVGVGHSTVHRDINRAKQQGLLDV